MRGESFFYNLNVCSKITVFLSVFLLVGGCSHNPKSVVVEELRSPPRVTKGAHVVSKGDSLYSIAWRYNWDFKELAAANGIRQPYTIYPGQRISLNVASARKTVPVTKWAGRKQTAISKSVVKKRTVKKPIKTVSVPQKSGWLWPASGVIIEPFSLTGHVNKGIDIRAKLGDAVRAAAAGEVVYAGNDLGGYGKLIIIKHNSSYLSAYAHNKDLYVREGDSVKASQKIAEIGSTGTTEPKLHFEIRRDGKPVDPMGYLPKR